MYDQAQLMLCHCIGGVIPGCGVIFDNSSDGYSCKHAAVCWKYYALYNKLVHSLLLEMMHNCTGCICSFYFSSVCCQMYPQIACSNGYIFTQVAFFYFSPLCIFKCVFKLLA